MNEKELYQQKKQAQLDEWQAEVDKLKAKAAEASADTQLEMKKDIEFLESKIDEGKNRLTEVADASEDAWKSMKDGMDSAWDSIKTSFSDAAAKIRN
jgi:hypothetical protein